MGLSTLFSGEKDVAPVENADAVRDAVRTMDNGGTEKRGRGRPRKDGAENKTARNNSANNQTDSAPPMPPVDVEFIKTSVGGALRALDQYTTQKFFNTTRQVLNNQNLHIAEGMRNEVAMKEGEVEMVAASVAAIAQKYSLLAQYLPETMLLLWATGYGTRVFLTHRKLEELAAWVVANNPHNVKQEMPKDASSPAGQ